LLGKKRKKKGKRLRGAQSVPTFLCRIEGERGGERYQRKASRGRPKETEGGCALNGGRGGEPEVM